MADHTGEQRGNYRLVRHLGDGAFADVYLGEHVYLKSYAALKVLHQILNEEDVERFLAEAQTLVALRHPNIVRVLEFMFEEYTPVLVMDYAQGGTARQRFPSESRLPLATVTAYIKQIADALQYAHNHSIIHRDVKPENILFDTDQQILLSDFGLALLAPSPELLSIHEWAGTIAYMAPEQIQKKPTFASDQYALGIITYEWLCGVRPFAGGLGAIINQHLFETPPSLREKRPDVPDAVERVVLKALAKDPRQRFTSMQAFAVALAKASQQNAIALLDDATQPLLAELKIISSPATKTETTLTQYSTLITHPRHIFLIAAHADERFASRLRADMEARGIAISCASEDHTAAQQDALRQAVRDARAIIVVVSPATRSSRTVKEQLRIAGMYQQRMVFVRAAGDELAQVLPEAWGRTALIDLVDARETRYPAAIDEIMAYLEERKPTVSPEEATLLAVPAELRNPFKGLHAFNREDAKDFFGRDTLIEELAETIEELLVAEKPALPGSRLLTVIGPSGSGKSSVVMAGLLPALQQSALPGSEGWVYLHPMVPGEHPLESLALACAPHLPKRSLRSIREDLDDDSARGLHLLAIQLNTQRGCKVVLTIDQFEEVFTQASSERERQRFIDLLVTAAMEPCGPLLILLTLRADLYDRPMQYPNLSYLIQAHQKAVLSMNPHELRSIIERPAVQPDVQVIFEDNLVGDLLFEAQGQIGALPLLEFTLDQLFRLREGRWLTNKAYRQIGGVKGALAKHAESTYTSLPTNEHRQLARALFLRLIDPGANEQDTTRRRAALSELSLPDPRQRALMREVADVFVAARLLTTNEVVGITTIEVSHEALIREWARFTEWLREARDDIILQQAISVDAVEWVRRGRPGDRLYRGTRLAEAQNWAERNVPSFEEMGFVKASREDQEREETEERVRQARELALQRQATQRQRYVIGLMAITSIVLIVALAFTLFQQSQLQITNQQLQNSLPASVINNHDSGTGSLREAIANAKPNSTITFEKDLLGPIRLANEIDITHSLILSGPGVKALSISGQGKHRVFRVLKGAVVTILNLTIQDGFASNCPGGCDTRGIKSNLIISDNDEHAGGAILNGVNATLTLINVTVSTSTGDYGAIFNNGTLTILGSHIIANKTSGLFNSNQGTLTLEESMVSGNRGATYGGGINSWGSATILTSTISDNTAIYGGGLYTSGNTNVATLENSTISDNTATTSGGGICSPKYGPNLVYTTVYENRAGAIGGGIAENAGEGCGNYASDPYNNYAFDISGSIIAGNSAIKDPDVAGNVSLNYQNLIQNPSIGTHILPCDQTTSQCVLSKKPLFNLSPLLGPLQDNGGPTPTNALLAGSPALDQISVDSLDPYGICANPNNPVYPVLSDQRGESRPSRQDIQDGKGCDIGAYEAQQ